MPKDIQSIIRLTALERRNLLKSARLVHRQAELDIRSLPRDSDSSRLPGRILIITPRKVGNAPQRNLLRRRLKAIFREEKILKISRCDRLLSQRLNWSYFSRPQNTHACLSKKLPSKYNKIEVAIIRILLQRKTMLRVILIAFITVLRPLIGPPGCCRYKLSCTKYARLMLKDLSSL